MKAFAFVLMLVLCLGSMTRAVPTQEVIDTIVGILVGTFGDHGQKAKECIQEGEVIFSEISQAITLFEKGDVKDIVEGLFHVGKALEEFPKEFADCQAAEDLVKDFKKIAEEFKDPKNLIVHVGYEILWNGKSIYNDITESVNQFRAGGYEKAGNAIGNIIKILFIDALTDRIADAASFIEGFFVGSLHEEAKDLVTCIEDGKGVIDTLEVIVALAKDGVLKNVEKIILTFVDLLSEIPKTVVMCEQAPKKMVKYLEWISKLKDVKLMLQKFWNAFKDHSDDIKRDFKNMIETFNNKDFKSCGLNLGDVFLILFEKTEPLSVNNLLKRLLN